MDYYSLKQFIAQVDAQGTHRKPVEKWKAHREGILHSGFTVALYYKNSLILQHRKHPAFDRYVDLTCSSHPIYINSTLQDEKDAVYDTLAREWNLHRSQVSNLVKKGSFIYEAMDPKSKLIEHEIFSIFTGITDCIPYPNFEYAYGFSLVPLSVLKHEESILFSHLTPWAKETLKRKLL